MKTDSNSQATTKPLHRDHERELCEGSGLTIETIRQAGIYSCSDRIKLMTLLNRKAWKYGSAIVFPCFNADGGIVLCRVKANNPPKDSQGKPRKYLQPSGQPLRLYVPPSIFPRLPDATAPLVIAEGEKKTLASTQAGFACVGLCGVDCWHDRGQVTLSADLARIAWQRREVFIAFDSDSADNTNVSRNERNLAAVLERQGAVVRVVKIPPAADGSKQGIDDFLVAHGKIAFQKLLHDAEEPEPPDSEDLKGHAKNAEPRTEAKRLISASEKNGYARIMFWRDRFWFWTKGRYREMTTAEIKNLVSNSASQFWFNIGTHQVSDIMLHLQALTFIPTEIEPPHWRADQPAGFEALECLAMRSQVIHLPSLAEQREVYSVPASPNFFVTNACQFDVDQEAPRPQAWLKFLDDQWADDPQSIETLQEWLGYLLTSDNSMQKMLMIIGPTRSGKGTIAGVISGLVGEVNVVNPTLGSLATNFGLQPLIAKTVALINDARLSGRTDQAMIVERLLSISGDDPQMLDRKHLQAITCKLLVRFVLFSNELPRLRDNSGAFLGRLIMLRTTKSFLGREDHDLGAKLHDELPGILLWAVVGWHRLKYRGHFLQPQSGTELLRTMGDIASPISAFVRDCCLVDPGAVVTVDTLYDRWKSWCVDQGREKFVTAKNSFCAELLAALPEIRQKRPRQDGDRVNCYQGIELRSDFD